MKKKRKVLVILGPTAVGKSDLAIVLAKKFNGELVACDSRQIYKGLDIGTGKEISGKYKVVKGEGFWEVNGIKIWMYDLRLPQEQFNLKGYIDRASLVVEDILNRGKLPIIVGGTGLYLKGLLGGLGLEVEKDKDLREELEKLSAEELQGKLKMLSPTDLEKMNLSDRWNKRRLIRKIEQFMYGYVDTQNQEPKSKSQNWDVLKIGLTAPRPFINGKIDSRLDARFNQGLITEGERLLENGVSLKRFKELGLEYGVLADYFEGRISKDGILERLKLKNHQYAKRQMTWFKKEMGINWFDITEKELGDVERLVIEWYDPSA